MPTRTISITVDAYESLKARKNGKESFSDVILSLTKRRPLTDFAGILTKEQAKKIEKRVMESRMLSIDRAKAVYGNF